MGEKRNADRALLPPGDAVTDASQYSPRKMPPNMGNHDFHVCDCAQIMVNEALHRGVRILRKLGGLFKYL